MNQSDGVTITVSPPNSPLCSHFAFAVSKFFIWELGLRVDMSHRFLIRGDEELATFIQQYVPEGCFARLPEQNEEPTIDPREGKIGLYPVFFFQAGLRLPLDRLLCDILRRCNLAPCQLSPNGLRVVLGCSALNKLLGVNLTWREIFYCYLLSNCPNDFSRYYFRARPKAPDLVKGLTKSETGYYGGMVIIGGDWDDGDIRKIKRYVQDNVVKPKCPSLLVVDFDSINPVLNYNGPRGVTPLHHPRAAHNLLGYTPLDLDFLPERDNLLDWLGTSKRLNKLEDRQKVKKKTPPRPVIHIGIAIRESPAELGGPSTAVPENRGKGLAVEQSQSSSDTPTDPELVGLYQEVEGTAYQDLRDSVESAGMAPKRRDIAQLLQDEAAAEGAGGGGPSVRAPRTAARKKPLP